MLPDAGGRGGGGGVGACVGDGEAGMFDADAAGGWVGFQGAVGQEVVGQGGEAGVRECGLSAGLGDGWAGVCVKQKVGVRWV